MGELELLFALAFEVFDHLGHGLAEVHRRFDLEPPWMQRAQHAGDLVPGWDCIGRDAEMEEPISDRRSFVYFAPPGDNLLSYRKNSVGCMVPKSGAGIPAILSARRFIEGDIGS